MACCDADNQLWVLFGFHLCEPTIAQTCSVESAGHQYTPFLRIAELDSDRQEERIDEAEYQSLKAELGTQFVSLDAQGDRAKFHRISGQHQRLSTIKMIGGCVLQF